MTKFTPRWYQEELSQQMLDILNEYGIVYLSAEVRTGKTFTSLMAAHQYGAKKVLFSTVKKAIGGIKEQVDIFGKLDVDVVSMDSLHKVDHKEYDFIILDEAHKFGGFPKPPKKYREAKKVVKNKPTILMSGTPSPESYSQLFHQFKVREDNPFGSYSTFYKWAASYVDIKERDFGYGKVKDYSDGKKEKIMQALDPYFVRFTQAEAGFKNSVSEFVLHVHMSSRTEMAIRKLKKDRVLYNDRCTILGDTPVKLMAKVHQMASGTVITEEGDYRIFDRSKVDYIRREFDGQKLAIFYKYKSELKMLKEEFGDMLTDDIVEFDKTDKHIALQVKAGSTGINLSAADAQVYLNIDFSSQDWLQSRARMQTKDRTDVKVYILASNCGIEREIYKALQKKEDYTTSHFKRTL